MSLRRHRVKATANLTNIKRKPRTAISTNTKDETVMPSEAEAALQEANVEIDIEAAAPPPPPTTTTTIPSSYVEKQLHMVSNASITPMHEVEDCVGTSSQELKNVDLLDASAIAAAETDTPTTEEQTDVESINHTKEAINTTAFKMPASANMLEDVFQSDIEDNVIQMDLQKSLNGYPMSPSKIQSRQRVRPTPVFGQRRNSFVCNSPSPHTGGGGGEAETSPMSMDFMSPGTPQRRERYLSGSSSSYVPGTPQPQMPQHKYFPQVMSPGMGRIRTESSCSAFSDTYSISGGGKQRKNNEEQKHLQQRLNAKRDFETRFNNGVPDKSKFKMFDLIYYNPNTNPMEQKNAITTIKPETTTSSSASTVNDESKPTKEELVDKVETSAMPVPQLKLNANGEMIIDEKTLEIETTAEQEARKVLANSSLILMDENTGMNGFYKRQKRTKGWTSEDTLRFYRSLQIIGTDFSLMCQLFPNRTRRDLKLKYKKEERINGALINKALLYPKVFNVQELKDQLEQEDREKEEAERQWKEILKRDATPFKKERNNNNCKAARAMKCGEFVYNNENIVDTKLGKRALNKKSKAAELVTNSDANLPEDVAGVVVETLDDLCNEEAATKPKRKRRRRVIGSGECVGDIELQQETIMQNSLPPFGTIKEEAKIKMEHSQYAQQQQQHQQQHGVHGDNDGLVLEQELAALLAEEPSAEYVMQEHSECQSKTENKIIVDLDDGTLTTYTEASVATATYVAPNELKMSAPAPAAIPSLHETQPSTLPTVVQLATTEAAIELDVANDAASDTAESTVSEHDIQQILTELAEGSLVLVSSLDPDNPDKEINEIYMVDDKTGDLCEKPLSIPENIVQCIMAVMS